MKKYSQLMDIILLVGLAGIALVAVAPKTLIMSSNLQMLLIATVLVLLSSFLVFVWREKPNDEREIQNQAVASRSAYTVGSIVLILALIIQSLNHNLDPAVPISLLAMIATKIVVQIITDGK